MGSATTFSVAEIAAGIEALTPAGQIARLRELEAHFRHIEAELAVAVHTVRAAQSFRTDGHASMRGLLRAELRWSEAEITHRLRTGALLTDLQPALDALAHGEIGVAQVRALARAHANPRCGNQLAADADLMLGLARTLEFDDFHRCMRRWETLADTDGSHRSTEDTHESRHAGLIERDGIGYLTGQGGAIDCAEMKEIWEQFTQAEFLNDLEATTAPAPAPTSGDGSATAAGQPQPGPGPLPRTHAQRRWDALLAIFRTAAGQPADTKQPESTLNVVIDLQTFEHVLHEMGLAPEPTVTVPTEHRRCETTNGIVVDPLHAVRAALWGHVRRVVVDTAGNVVDLGRRRRLFTGTAREAVMLHSPRCIWPGCPTPAGHCNADHTQDWQHGGLTASVNGAPMCPRHDRRKNNGYRVHRDASGQWHTYRPDGTEIGAAACTA